MPTSIGRRANALNTCEAQAEASICSKLSSHYSKLDSGWELAFYRSSAHRVVSSTNIGINENILDRQEGLQ